MRAHFAILSLPLFALAACGGDTSPQTVGSVAPPAAPPAATPTPSAPAGGNGSGVTAGAAPVAPAAQHFLQVGSATTFDVVGSFHSLVESDTAGTLYQGNAATVRSPSGKISYDPRDGVFTLTVADTKAGVSRDLRFQDPAHRVDFNPETRPELEVPNLDGFNYLRLFDGETNATFFYQRPGNSTAYVTLGGYVRTAVGDTETSRERGVFVFGQQTPRAQVPISGSGNYTGGFIASMVMNPTGDNVVRGTDYLQWLYGASTVGVNFATGDVTLAFSGRSGPTYDNGVRVGDGALTIPTNAIFTAEALAKVDWVRAGGFVGEFTSAGFQLPNGTVIPIDFARVSPGASTAGASSLDGGFFGPDAINLGGNFRIIGGIPDQRVDVQGAFTGARK